ncbi:alginate O-acetyltransferase AlgF [uncultured Roseobacter sp.]|uniref:alginate O-acetyltransferase AlgF n=1 Tax=uncultured Roseobacter sp. TaxID=114847 RepID=UPI002622F418|nr:alginate O-acetyltransferase AlgF [uncultured Roseobacter sp.]
MIRHLSLAFCLSAAFLPGGVAASDTSLYAEPAPEDASFIRFAGFNDVQTAHFAGKSFDLSDTDDMAYVPVSSAALNGIAPGSFLTVVQQPDGRHAVIPEDSRDAAARVYLFLLNATDDVLELRTADGAAPVIEGVTPLTSGARAVNPVAIALGVFAKGDATALATFDVTLKRGQNLSFIAEASGIRLVENHFGPVAD